METKEAEAARRTLLKYGYDAAKVDHYMNTYGGWRMWQEWLGDIDPARTLRGDFLKFYVGRV